MLWKIHSTSYHVKVFSCYRNYIPRVSHVLPYIKTDRIERPHITKSSSTTVIYLWGLLVPTWQGAQGGLENLRMKVQFCFTSPYEK